MRKFVSKKRNLRVCSGSKKVKGIVRADSGNKNGKRIARAGTRKQCDF